jgi:hypothetical protein
MECKKCGQLLSEKDRVCANCGEPVDLEIKGETKEVTQGVEDENDYEDAGQKKAIESVEEPSSDASEAIEEADIEEVDTVKKVELPKEPSIQEALYEETNAKKTNKRSAKEFIGKGFKLITALSILLFIILMLFNWYNFGGEASYKGFAAITKSIMSEELAEFNGQIPEGFQGSYVVASPVNLIKHVIDYRGTYKSVVKTSGETKTSIFSILNIVYILLYIGTILLGLISILILLFSKGLKGINFVKISSFITAGVVGLNYLAFKVTYFSMIAINAQSNLIAETGAVGVSMNKDGILINTTTYLYDFSLEPTFFKALICLGIWLAISTVLGEIKRNKGIKAKEAALKEEALKEEAKSVV